MGSHSKTYKATAAPSVGANWSNAANIYDSDVDSYASRNAKGTSATHINGFGISLPSNASVTSLQVHSKLYASNAWGYLCVYVYSDSGPTNVISKEVVDGASLSAKYVTHTYTASQLITALNDKGLHSGNLVEFFKNLRVRFVIGSSSSLFNSECRVYDNYVVVNYTIPDYTLTVNAGTGGTVTGGGTYENGTTATLTATANTGYKFKQWSDGNTQNPRSVTVTANATYTAQFEKLTYSVTASASPAEGGTINGAGIYSYGDTATLTAIPNDGYKFVQWSDGFILAIRSFTVTSASSFTAIFEKAAISNTFRGTSRQTVYGGIKEKSVYVGTKKIT